MLMVFALHPMHMIRRNIHFKYFSYIMNPPDCDWCFRWFVEFLRVFGFFVEIYCTPGNNHRVSKVFFSFLFYFLLLQNETDNILSLTFDTLSVYSHIWSKKNISFLNVVLLNFWAHHTHTYTQMQTLTRTPLWITKYIKIHERNDQINWI